MLLQKHLQALPSLIKSCQLAQSLYLQPGSCCGSRGWAQGWLALWGSGVALWGSGVALWGWVPTPLMRGSTSQAVPW